MATVVAARIGPVGDAVRMRAARPEAVRPAVEGAASTAGAVGAVGAAGAAGAPAAAAGRRGCSRRGGGARLTRRGRVVVTLLVLLVLLVAGFSMGRVSSQAAGPTPATRPLTVTVHPGETLWQVAGRVAPHVDPRIVVAQIERLNHLSSAEVQAGQQLMVPRAG